MSHFDSLRRFRNFALSAVHALTIFRIPYVLNIRDEPPTRPDCDAFDGFFLEQIRKYDYEKFAHRVRCSGNFCFIKI